VSVGTHGQYWGGTNSERTHWHLLHLLIVMQKHYIRRKMESITCEKDSAFQESG